MQPRSALQQASCRLRLAACPYRIRLHPGRNSPYYYVYETRAGGRSQSARGYRIDQNGDLAELVELLLAAQRNLLRGGPGLDWRRLHLAPGEQPPADCGPLQTWGEIRSQSAVPERKLKSIISVEICFNFLHEDHGVHVKRIFGWVTTEGYSVIIDDKDLTSGKAGVDKPSADIFPQALKG